MTDATFAYDDECGFCTWVAQQLLDHSDMDVVGFSDLTDEELERLPADWEEGAHLLTEDEVYSHGEAIEQAFLRADVSPPGADDVFGFLRQFQDYDRFRERLYREAAERRDVWSFLRSEEAPARRD